MYINMEHMNEAVEVKVELRDHIDAIMAQRGYERTGGAAGIRGYGPERIEVFYSNPDNGRTMWIQLPHAYS